MAALKPAWLLLALTGSAPARAQIPEALAGPVATASARFGIPEQWIRRVIQLESAGRNSDHGQPLVSRAGAMGVMQLMPGTWRDMRSMIGLGLDPFDPSDNILAGAAYLRLMYDRFGYPGLFGAYNAGPARYAKFLRTARPLPHETRLYLARVTLDAPIRRLRSNRLAPAAGLFAARGPEAASDGGRDSRMSPLFVPLAELGAR